VSNPGAIIPFFFRPKSQTGPVDVVSMNVSGVIRLASTRLLKSRESLVSMPRGTIGDIPRLPRGKPFFSPPRWLNFTGA